MTLLIKEELSYGRFFSFSSCGGAVPVLMPTGRYAVYGPGWKSLAEGNIQTVGRLHSCLELFQWLQRLVFKPCGTLGEIAEQVHNSVD